MVKGWNIVHIAKCKCICMFGKRQQLQLSVSLQNQTSWVLSSMAALYWRVKGQGKKAIDCLRQALHYAPHQMKVSWTLQVGSCVAWAFPFPMM